MESSREAKVLIPISLPFHHLILNDILDVAEQFFVALNAFCFGILSLSLSPIKFQFLFSPCQVQVQQISRLSCTLQKAQNGKNGTKFPQPLIHEATS